MLAAVLHRVWATLAKSGNGQTDSSTGVAEPTDVYGKGLEGLYLKRGRSAGVCYLGLPWGGSTGRRPL